MREEFLQVRERKFRLQLLPQVHPVKKYNRIFIVRRLRTGAMFVSSGPKPASGMDQKLSM